MIDVLRKSNNSRSSRFSFQLYFIFYRKYKLEFILTDDYNHSLNHIIEKKTNHNDNNNK